MKNFFVALFYNSISLLSLQVLLKIKVNKKILNQLQAHFLNSSANQLSISSNLIATESLDKSKELYLKMAFDYDPTGESNAMMLLPANKIKSMTSAEVWDHMNKVGSTMEKLDMNIEWNIVKTEIKNDYAFVSYDVKGREQKIIQLKKENNSWKVILSFGSIF